MDRLRRRHYAISHKLLPGILNDVSIMRERAYTMDSAVMAHVVRRGGRIEPVWLGVKEHEPITARNLFNRLQDLVHSVFDDVDRHLSVVRKLSPGDVAVQPSEVPATSARMRELIGFDFRRDLQRDMATRFRAAAPDIRQTLGATAYERVAALRIGRSRSRWFCRRAIGRRHRAVSRALRASRDSARKSRLARACVPVLEAGYSAFSTAPAILPTPRPSNASMPISARLPAHLGFAFEAPLLYRLALPRRWPARVFRRFSRFG